MARERDSGTTKTQVRPGGRAGGKRSSPPRGRSVSASPGAWGEHASELVGLAALGLAIFLIFVLLAGERGGVVGRLAGDGLGVVLGRLAFLVPLGLLVAAVLLVFEVRLRWRSVWAIGAALLVIGLLLLVSAGFPPLGDEHGPLTFVREAYRLRAGWVGEVAYVAGLRLGGEVGVAITGWLLLVAGGSLASGLTVRRAVLGTGKAAQAATAGAQEKAHRLRERRAALDQGSRAGPLDDPYLSGFGPPPTSEELQEAGLHPDSAFDDVWPEGPWPAPGPGAGGGGGGVPGAAGAGGLREHLGGLGARWRRDRGNRGGVGSQGPAPGRAARRLFRGRA